MARHGRVEMQQALVKRVVTRFSANHHPRYPIAQKQAQQGI
jgi:hypothetical protein